MEITGTVHRIYDKQQVSDKFAKRDIIIKTEEGNYPQFLKIQFTQAKCDLLDHNQPGDIVTISINLRGKEYTNKSGGLDYFNTIEGWKINTSVKTTPANQAIQAEVSDHMSSDLPF